MTLRSLWKRLSLVFSASLLAAASAQAGATPERIAGGFTNPESVCLGPDGTLYLTELGEPGKAGDGKVSAIKDGKPRVFAEGLNDPKGIVYFREALYLTDGDRVVKVDMQGKTSVYQAPEKFPTKPRRLNDIAVDVGHGLFLVTEEGDGQGKGGAVFLIDVRLDKVETVADTSWIPALNIPNGVAFDGEQHFLIADWASGNVHRVKRAGKEDRWTKTIATGLDGADGLVWDHYGRLFITSWKTGKIFAIPRPGEKPILIGEGLQSAADACLSADGKSLLIPDMKAGTLSTLSTKIPGWEVDDSPAPVRFEPAFQKLKWKGYDDGSESGKAQEFRPIVLASPPDGSNRLWVATQQGVVHSFENREDAQETKIVLDFSQRSRYDDKKNEEGFLGLAFHPKFKDNGQVYVFYTETKSKSANVLSWLRLKKDGSGTVDPDSEEVLIRFEKPDWNHDGGSIAFGPDGCLYVSNGDGGGGGDPHENGQNLKTLLGKIHRIDVDRKEGGLPYAVPKDNPFVGRKDVRPEIYAYGLRNVWRMAFDRKTGILWGGEVGQNVFEEIILVTKGGNYGWNLREALHPFGRKGVDVDPKLVEPIWEYHHDVGRSITGGNVYRGKDVPALDGFYVYSDYVSGRIWALQYDAAKGRVVANRPLPGPGLQALSFGEDAAGEIYLLRASSDGKTIFRLTASAAR